MALLHINDTLATYPDSYYHATAELLPQQTPLIGEHHTDICIIGAGYTGLCAALTLAQKGFKVSVLEAHRLGWGASGRNGGQLGSGQRLDQIQLEQKYGTQQAQYLWQQAEEAKNHVKSLIHIHNIDAELTPGLLYADHKLGYQDATKAYVDKLQNDYAYSDVSYLTQRDLSQYLGTNVYYGGSLDMGAGHLHPLKYCLGLAKAALKAGVRIFEASEVISLETHHKNRIFLRTPRGRLHARKLVYACNGYGQRILPSLDRYIMPINNFIR